jgi:predicted subunit of tRNA(5-methylaminomethyl-2-thiouridylate) methyltransferase
MTLLRNDKHAKLKQSHQQSFFPIANVHYFNPLRGGFGLLTEKVGDLYKIQMGIVIFLLNLGSFS